MGKLSSYSADSSPTTDDYIPTIDTTSGLNKKTLISSLITLFFNNIPASSDSSITRSDESEYDYVASGGVWTGDSYGVNRNASMSTMIVYINGRRITIASVAARTFTASRDTYIDVLDNANNTGTLVYTEVTNNNASPALASNSIRIGIIVTGASTIAAATSVNQGQPDRVLPIASSVPYQVTDSLGNMIFNTAARPVTIGYRQKTGTQVFSTNTAALITEFVMPIKIPAARKCCIEIYPCEFNSNASATTPVTEIFDGAVGGTRVAQAVATTMAAGNYFSTAKAEVIVQPSLTAISSKTYQGSARNTASVSTTLQGYSTGPAFISARLQ